MPLPFREAASTPQERPASEPIEVREITVKSPMGHVVLTGTTQQAPEVQLATVKDATLRSILERELEAAFAEFLRERGTQDPADFKQLMSMVGANPDTLKEQNEKIKGQVAATMRRFDEYAKRHAVQPRNRADES